VSIFLPRTENNLECKSASELQRTGACHVVHCLASESERREAAVALKAQKTSARAVLKHTYFNRRPIVRAPWATMGQHQHTIQVYIVIFATHDWQQAHHLSCGGRLLRGRQLSSACESEERAIALKDCIS